MNKAEIRKAAILERKKLTPEQVETLSIQIRNQFATLDFSAVNVIHLFLPILEKNEPDTFLIVDWLKENHPHIKIIIPRANFGNSLMTHHAFTSKEDLKKNEYGIPEPFPVDVHIGKIDMVLVPMLAFDLHGYRVGYGKGFYDRFLQGLDAKKVGLNFFEAQNQISNVDEYDVRLDLCITPQKIYAFSSNNTGQ
ncbi:5-formyltetrahydrofolate cyclo-ligase [Pedobacter sp. MC2016-14]|uniref:5-formyltetrahydrofolate cyclo-ligase n=1 Tax=Pedobacter sp. MC2016-14 TaxID=2897327 RepID=UPI001E2979D0|nr:5-formyltetrahydrofolate cyclo-ligase [Pedobacter sp. MC2016-14]MCD0487315.1 5-formyltetrahydrofolate cyclo-ligase [Pedobacter sp. MC2016-14]